MPAEPSRGETAEIMRTTQLEFAQSGGLFRMPMIKMKAEGTMPRSYVYREYPKAIVLEDGPPREVKRSTLDCEKKVVEWTETVRQTRTIIVNNEDEEERVLAGGKTSAQIEEDRQALLSRCARMNIPADPSWSAVRLRRELGEALDAPAPASPGDNMAALEKQVAALRKMAAMRAEIVELTAQLSKDSPAAPSPVVIAADDEDMDAMRAQLSDLGVKVDKRWSAATLRAELERATAPS
tara:strand:- start:609 stop:1322 length:714 start_codon:yes stop_codon:yes gene_type:complete